MSDKIFSIQENLTEEYQRYFNNKGVIGYFKSPYELEPKKKKYYLCFNNGKLIFLGKSLEAVDKRLQEIYYADQLDFLDPTKTAPIVAEQKKEGKTVKKRKTAKMTPKRRDLIKQISMIETWGRGVIAKIATKLGRKIGAVRQMLSVLTKNGLLVRVRRGQYALGANISV
ncbi:MAG: hypothetical protein ABFS56_26525 [Pseudomonadota bacterium]